MLGWRLALSAILIPLLFVLFWVDHRAGETAPVLLVLAVLLGVRSAWEFTVLLRPRFASVSFPVCAAGVVMLLGAAWVPHWAGREVHWAAGLGLTGLAFGVCVLLLLAEEARRYTAPGSSMETLGAHLLVIAYAGLLLAVTAQLRWVIGSQGGFLALGLLVVVTKMGDTSAYTVGRLFGKRKMAPLLSPGKTWAGALGAVVGAGLSGWVWLYFATPLFDQSWSAGPWHCCVLAGVAIGVAGMIGDLCESLIKRDMGQKDAAALMPGFGGLLDLLDSVLYAGPVAYLLWLVLPLRVVSG